MRDLRLFIHNGISSVDVLEYEDQIFLSFFWGGVGLVGFVVLWESGNFLKLVKFVH